MTTPSRNAAPPIKAADLFCGAGGTSTGLLQACEAMGLRLDLLAVNHWPLAIQTHMANHPGARHACASLQAIDLGPGNLFPSVDAIDPRQAVSGAKLDLLVASPECTHHSNARGGRPVNDQSRSTPWCILRWADAVQPRTILVENVPEFASWGPIGSNGRPLKTRKGETFAAFLTALEALGYTVEHRILNAADFGDATTRRRLFVIATRGRLRPTWPAPTHTKGGGGGLPAWRPAREIIDWGVESESIFTPGRRLAPKTIERIAAGLRRYCGPWAEPFLDLLNGTSDSQSLEAPLAAVTAEGDRLALLQPFLLPHRTFRNMAVDSVDSPLRTITAHSSDFELVEPFLVPFFGERPGQDPRTHSVDQPLPAVTSHGAGGLVQPFLAKYNGTGGGPRSVENPLGTVTTKDRYGLVEPWIASLANTTDGPRNYDLDRPLPTQTGTRTFGLVEPRIVDIAGDRYLLDIRFRMLQPHELAAAMSFPRGYRFHGTRDEQVKQIGNAVAVGTARALCTAMLRPLAGAAVPTSTGAAA